MKRFKINTLTIIPLAAILLILISLLTISCNNTSSGVSQDAYDEIESELNTAQNEIDGLEDEKDSLQVENQQLQNEKNGLQDNYDALDGDYQQLKDQNDELQDDYDTFANWYDGIREEVNQRQGDLEDEKLFVTPDDTEVANKVQLLTGGYSENINEVWDDIEDMYDWVVGNIEYNSDSRLPYLPYYLSPVSSISWHQDYWRMPSETLADEVGDCEDMATLLASMIINYFSSEGYPCWCIIWHSDESGHAAVAFPVENDKLTILDPAGNYRTGTYYSLGSDDISIAVNDWLDHWKPEPGIYVSGVFSETVYETFDTTEEFVEWVLSE